MKLKHRLYISLRKLTVFTHVQTSLGKRKRKTRKKGKQRILNLNLFIWALGFSWKNRPTTVNSLNHAVLSLLAWFSNAVSVRGKQLADKFRIPVARRKSLATEQTFAPT